MIILDLFAVLRGWSEAFETRGHTCYTIEMNPVFKNISYTRDILTMDPNQCPFRPDVIVASPPCEGFSVMQIGKNWNKDDTPKTPKAEMAMQLVLKTIEFIDVLKPQFFVIENPRAKLRKMKFMERFERREVTYCQYGEHRMKPTDLWGGFPTSLSLLPRCNNGDPCHTAAPRGSTTGSQGMDSASSAKIPFKLALEICLACERDLK
jgi:hypothetical protein